MGTNKKTARLAGFLWLLMFIFGPIAQIVRSKIFVIGDIEATANNILANETGIYRTGVGVDGAVPKKAMGHGIFHTTQNNH